MRSISSILLAGALLLMAATPASAVVTPGSAGGTQVFLESDGAGDNLALRCEGGQVKYEAIELLPCNVVQDIFITGNGGNDVVNLASINATDLPKLTRVEIDGGTGTDVINGSQVADTIESDALDVVTAGPGNDTINGGLQVTGGPGDDILESSRGSADGGPGDDVFKRPSELGPYNGGPGFDTFDYDLSGTGLTVDLSITPVDSGFTLTIPIVSQTVFASWSSIDKFKLSLLTGGTQTVDASQFSGVFEVDGNGGPDILTGGPNEDFIRGGPGNDELTGGGQFDFVSGGTGEDRLLLRDGVTDRGACGEGTDSVVGDAVDSLFECETINLPAPPDITAPDTTGLKGPKQVTKGKAATFKFSSTEAGSSFKCKVDKGKTTTCASPFKVKTGNLKPGKHTFSVFAVDAAGNADPTPATQNFTVNAAKPKPHKRAGHKRGILEIVR